MRTLVSEYAAVVAAFVHNDTIALRKHNGQSEKIAIGEYCSLYNKNFPAFNPEKFVILEQKGYRVIADANLMEIKNGKLRKQLPIQGLIDSYLADMQRSIDQRNTYKTAEKFHAEAQLRAEKLYEEQQLKAKQTRDGAFFPIATLLAETHERVVLADGSVMKPQLYNRLKVHNEQVEKDYQKSKECVICVAYL